MAYAPIETFHNLKTIDGGSVMKGKTLEITACKIALLFALIIFAVASGELNAQGQTTSVTLTWTAPGDDGNTGTASQYDIRYSTSPINDGNWDAAIQVQGEPDPQPAGTEESFTITGLEPNTAYYFAIMTADEVPNWSGLSNIASVTTNDTESPADIANLAATPSE